MSYFSPRSTWMSLVEGPESWTPGHEDHALSAPGELQAEEVSDYADRDQLLQTRELRRRLFFQHQELEFGPALFGDLLKLARTETGAEEALAYYCEARHVAKVLVESCDRGEFLAPWLETDRVIAELHHLAGNFESCAVYAREGLETIKRNRFEAGMDMKITKLAIRFFQLLGRH